MLRHYNQMKECLDGTGKTVLLSRTLSLLIAAGVAAALILPTSCYRDRSESSSESPTSPEIPETPETPTIPELTSTPYLNADDVWISMRYTPEHQGIDFSATKNIPVRAPGLGTFYKHLYFHPGVPRWQVNTEIYIGNYSIDLLFEPGDSVTKVQAQTQYDMLIADGTPVNAGDSLGMLYVAPGSHTPCYTSVCTMW
ncbi:hypothetical protein MUP95_07165 [bacterium]|nr:hypothetical protein [bacterium]